MHRLAVYNADSDSIERYEFEAAAYLMAKIEGVS